MCFSTLLSVNNLFRLVIIVCIIDYHHKMGHIMTKPVLCHMRTTKTHSCSLISVFVIRSPESKISIDAIPEISRLASLCSRADRFESYLVANPHRFSRDVAQITYSPNFYNEIATVCPNMNIKVAAYDTTYLQDYIAGQINKV